MSKPKRKPLGIRIVGVMTGTSCDGLDAACMDVSPEGFVPAWRESLPYPAKLRARVLEVQKPRSKHTLHEILQLNRDLGDWYGAALSRLIAKHHHPREMPEVIANHGQTIAHFPSTQGTGGTTLQLGDPSRIAAKTGLTVVAHFRDGDMAAGGQGAPLVPLYHRMLARHAGVSESGFSIHNIGGISNLTYIGHGQGNCGEEVLAFDTGPGNIWIDLAASHATRGRQKMDLGGKMAARGTADLAAVKRLLRHPYFNRKPPKSTGRDDFPFEVFLRECKGLSEDSLVATATALTATSIALSYRKFILGRNLPLSSILVCGGGAMNPTLLSEIQAALPSVNVVDLASKGLDPQYVEAEAFAVFGYLALIGKPVGGSWTGAKAFGPPAHIIPGRNWAKIASKLAVILNGGSDPEIPEANTSGKRLRIVRRIAVENRSRSKVAGAPEDILSIG